MGLQYYTHAESNSVFSSLVLPGKTSRVCHLQTASHKKKTGRVHVEVLGMRLILNSCTACNPCVVRNHLNTFNNTLVQLHCWELEILCTFQLHVYFPLAHFHISTIPRKEVSVHTSLNPIHGYRVFATRIGQTVGIISTIKGQDYGKLLTKLLSE